MFRDKRLSWASTCVMACLIALQSAVAQAPPAEPPGASSRVPPRAFGPATLPPLNLSEAREVSTKLQSLLEKTKAATVNIQIGGASGSGVIVSKEGLVLTAGHVSGTPGQNAKITFADGRSVKAKSLGQYTPADAGMIQITDPGEYPTVPVGKSGELQPGVWCFALGYPGGYDKARGPVLRLGRLIQRDEKTLWTDNTLLGGDSGGPLFDLEGRVIGIHSRISGPVTANFHASIDSFLGAWDHMVQGEIWRGDKHPTFGAKTVLHEKGVLVQSVAADSPAGKAGIRENDVIIKFDGKDPKNPQTLTNLVNQKNANDTVKVVVVRDEQEVTLDVKLEPAKPAAKPADKPQPEKAVP